ncbi:MAG TPA: hypothetical protein VNO30_49725 [Kofleriaceae bacterium]|nr:hypothetical protein [Kofleriaceae bacterium]
MSDQPDDPHGRAKRPGEAGDASAPAAPAGSEGYPPPMFAPAAPAAASHAPPSFAALVPAAEGASAEPATPRVVSGVIDTGAAAATPADEPLLPARYSETELRSAVRSPAAPEPTRPRGYAPALDDSNDGDHDDADAGRSPRRRKAVLAVGAGLIAVLGIAALVVLGRMNAGRYAVSCDTKLVTAEHGRSFPPWGMSRLGGDAWKPISIPPSFQCVGLETEDAAELGDAYRKMLVERAESLLTAKEKEPAQIDQAAGMLEQALLHARSDSDPHKSARQGIQRMLGDVAYWRASAALQKATTELAAAAKQFEAAAGQLPRFVSDANAWATHVRRLLEELRSGPAGAKPPAPAVPATTAAAPVPAAPDRPLAPAGVALPVEPGRGGSSAAGTGSSAGTSEPPPAPASPPDAGVPTGGVLL